jgi:hypothetical protein
MELILSEGRTVPDELFHPDPATPGQLREAAGHARSLLDRLSAVRRAELAAEPVGGVDWVDGSVQWRVGSLSSPFAEAATNRFGRYSDRLAPTTSTPRRSWTS